MQSNKLPLNEEFKKSDHLAMAKGIGRRATFDELADYQTKENNQEPIDVKEAFSKYLTSGQA